MLIIGIIAGLWALDVIGVLFVLGGVIGVSYLWSYEKDDFTNNALIEIDVKSGEYTIMRGVDILNLTVIKDITEHTLLVCYKNNGSVNLGQISHSGKIEDVATKKIWVSRRIL